MNQGVIRPRIALWPGDELEPVSNCPICGSSARRTMHPALIDDTFFTAAGEWKLQGCGDCGSAYLDPRPTSRSIARAYARYYTHAPEHRGRAGGLKLRIKALMRVFSDAYIASLRDGAAGRSGFSRQAAAACIRLAVPFREVIDAQFRHLRSPAPDRNRLLDLGCGAGDFLERAKLLGWRAEGVDFDPQAVAAARARGLEAREGSIDSYADTCGEFDVVTCNHVIEHVYDPVQMISAIHRLLKPGGLLWIETPNVCSAGHELFGRAWRGLEAPRHIALFSHHALVDTLQKAGFSVSRATPFNIQHIRMMFASSEAMDRQEDPSSAKTPLIPNIRLLRGLWSEIWQVHRREFVSLRALKR